MIIKSNVSINFPISGDLYIDNDNDYNAAWLHVENYNDKNLINNIINNLVSDKLAVFLCSGDDSENLHDMVDDSIYYKYNSYRNTLTAWSDESFKEVAWEFFDIYLKMTGIYKAAAFILTDGTDSRLKRMHDICDVVHKL